MAQDKDQVVKLTDSYRSRAGINTAIDNPHGNYQLAAAASINGESGSVLEQSTLSYARELGSSTLLSDMTLEDVTKAAVCSVPFSQAYNVTF